MSEAVTPPNPARSSEYEGTSPDPTLMTIDALRREIAMSEAQTAARFDAIESLIQERVRRIDALMERAEAARLEQKSDTREAVSAALESQKEATAKMEDALAGQISALRDNFETSIRSVRGTVDDLKDRMTAAESVRQGIDEQKTVSRSMTAGSVASIGVGASLLLVLVAVLSYMAAIT